MPNLSYRKGKNHENYIKSKYRDLGFYVIRSGGSKGAVDLIAIKRGNPAPIIIPVQCKAGSSRLTPDDRRKIEEFEEKTGLRVKVE